MLLSRVQAFALQRGTVYDLLVGRHLLPDIHLGYAKMRCSAGMSSMPWYTSLKSPLRVR